MKHQDAAKARIKDNKDWSSIYFWAENDDEANQIWEKRFKSDWPSMEYKLEKVEKDA